MFNCGCKFLPTAIFSVSSVELISILYVVTQIISSDAKPLICFSNTKAYFLLPSSFESYTFWSIGSQDEIQAPSTALALPIQHGQLVWRLPAPH
mmetsp:Transcript_32833/g.87103  ORF Transcript_32833/g.87103 Transcript_32833/m.87103 type:complete len:94 (-) Transcript_32833:379-660(-)